VSSDKALLDQEYLSRDWIPLKDFKVHEPGRGHNLSWDLIPAVVLAY